MSDLDETPTGETQEPSAGKRSDHVVLFFPHGEILIKETSPPFQRSGYSLSVAVKGLNLSGSTTTLLLGERGPLDVDSLGKAAVPWVQILSAPRREVRPSAPEEPSA